MAARPELRPRDAAAGIEQVSSSWSSLIPSIASLCLQCLHYKQITANITIFVLFLLCNFEQTNVKSRELALLILVLGDVARCSVVALLGDDRRRHTSVRMAVSAVAGRVPVVAGRRVHLLTLPRPIRRLLQSICCFASCLAIFILLYFTCPVLTQV